MLNRWFAALSMLMVACNAWAYDIYHKAPEHFLQGVPGQLEVILPDYLDHVDHVKLYLRPVDQDLYEELNFYGAQGSWFCDIPAAYMNTDTLCYFISASFGPAGFAALPAIEPDKHPFKIPLIKFNLTKKKVEPEFVAAVITDYEVTPWKPTPARRSNNFPILYVPKTNNAFIESGYIRIVGNTEATAEDLLKSMLYLCESENGDAITQLKYSLLASKPDLEQIKGHIELEGVYLRRPVKK